MSKHRCTVCNFIYDDEHQAEPFATAGGGLGIRVDDPRKLGAAVKEAFDSRLPSLVEVMVDKERMAPSTKSPTA